jgi:hypothetical protein
MPAECAAPDVMIDIADASVEVSGWDAEGQFFVEIAGIEIGSSGETATRLCHRVLDGSLVFVRLVNSPDQPDQQKGHPTPNEAHPMDSTEPDGRCRVRLTPCQPRSPRRPGDQIRATRI